MSARTLDEVHAAIGSILRAGPMHVDGAIDHAAPLVLAMLDEARAAGRLEGRAEVLSTIAETIAREAVR